MEMVGSRYWMAPEMLRGQPYGTPIDIYSFGCVVMEMADGQPPYYDLHQLRAVFSTATLGAPALRFPNRWSDTFKDFLSRSLTPDPSSRPTAAQLLRHPFLRLLCPAKRIRSIFETCFLGRALSMKAGLSQTGFT
jgi:serine/threonine protein kinase